MSYRIDLFDASGNRQAILQNEILTSATLDLSLSSAPTLTISMPLSEDKSSFISSLYDARIYNINSVAYEHSIFRLYNTEIVDSTSELQITAEYQGILTRLSDEFVDSYDTGSAGNTFANVINDLLAYQVNTPAITAGTLEPTPTVAIALESTDIYSALNSIRDAFGGWFEVDSDLSLNWYTDNTGDPYREIRRSKNLKSINYTPQYSKIVNRVYAYGKGEGEARIDLTDAGEANEYIDDADSQALYGVRAKKFIDKRITHPETLLRYAQRILEQYKNPPYQYTVDVLNLAEVQEYDYSLESLSLDTRIRVIDDLLGVDVDTSIISISLDLLAPENIEIELSTVRNDISDMFLDIRRTQDIADSVATKIGAGQVVVQGTFVVQDWVSGTNTTIDGGNITAGTITANEIAANTITTNELNFTPTDESNVIGTINASTEGITISANKITLAGTVETTDDIQSSNYSSGSSGWIIDGGGTAEFNQVTVRGTVYASSGSFTGTISSGGLVTAASGSRVEILPDANTGVVVYSGTDEVFRCNVGGTDVGDVIIGNYSGGAGCKWDDSASTFSIAGTLQTATLESGKTMTVVGNLESDNFSTSSETGWRLAGGGGVTVSDLNAMGDVICNRLDANLIYIPTNPNASTGSIRAYKSGTTYALGVVIDGYWREVEFTRSTPI